MDLQTRKLSFIQEFIRIQDEKTIRSLEELARKNRTELYEQNLQPMSLEQLHSELEIALEDSANDLGSSSKDLLDEIKNWK